ncbi:hypothetical protein F5879DRAFT_69180 [Lentinula edodes]|nr:hypothetical protein F5879DRAFT_69180 [Lentinula edodes]
MLHPRFCIQRKSARGRARRQGSNSQKVAAGHVPELRKVLFWSGNTFSPPSLTQSLNLYIIQCNPYIFWKDEARGKQIEPWRLLHSNCTISYSIIHRISDWTHYLVHPIRFTISYHFFLWINAHDFENQLLNVLHLHLTFPRLNCYAIYILIVIALIHIYITQIC